CQQVEECTLCLMDNARPHLVGHLKNLSVIVENLYQKEVFTGEEVSKIEAETDDYDKTRKILDLVINKGEDACYLLLRIIDMTRKRTLERLPLLPVKRRAVSAETKEFDLHHWISCFPFKEDFWMKSKNLFEENNKMSRPKKMRTYIPEDKREMSPSDLLKTVKNILVVGKPGIGKTALSHELLKVWAERGGEELDYMFYFDMREAAIIRKDMSLEDLLFSVFTEPDEGKEDVLEDIKKNSDNVTVIFDGLTDLSSPVVKRLVKQDLLPDAKIIITCRPEDEETFFSEDSLRVEVKGFSEQTIKTYLCATLGDKRKKVLSNVELFTLCHVPMYALMVAVCCASHSPQPCTVTEIYINIVRFCLQINSHETIRRMNSFIKNKSKEILSLAEVAFLATEGKTVNLAELPYEDSCVFSFLKPLCVKASINAITDPETTYAFLHYTMQEFFAALWLLKSPDHIKAVFQQLNKLFSLFHVAAELDDLLLVFYERLKTERCLNVLPSLRPLFQLTPSVWSIDLSERKASILLEVLKLQTEKKHVKLTGCSHGESEVKSLLQCLPYISQLR
uniref:NACHT domain-containing protein n=1 Tax=Monopterus albus TaxID=43700 RepID=A0A3Q3QAC2_MONAL